MSGTGGVSERIEVACAARLDYLPHAATMLASLFANAGAPVRAHLLVGPDIPREDLARVERFASEAGGELVVHRVDEGRFEGFGTTSTLPLAHWYRTLLPVLLTEQPRVLYLDSDLLVLEPLVRLWRLELGESWLAAVTNPFPDPDSGAAYCRALGIDPGGYFNSGVMLLDLDALRAARSFERVREFALAHGDKLILPEQDAFNAVAGPRRLPLDRRWNMLVGFDRHPASAAEEAGAAPGPGVAIRHFEGSRNKPWQPGAPEEIGRLWDVYRSRTPWAREPAAARRER